MLMPFSLRLFVCFQRLDSEKSFQSVCCTKRKQPRVPARTFICGISFLWILWSSCNSAELLHLQLVLMKLKLLAIWREQLLPPEGEIKRKIPTPPPITLLSFLWKGQMIQAKLEKLSQFGWERFLLPSRFLSPTLAKGGDTVTAETHRDGCCLCPQMASPSFWVQQMVRVPHTRKKLPPN